MAARRRRERHGPGQGGLRRQHDAVQPDFEIIAKEYQQTTQNLEELDNEHIRSHSPR